MRGYQKIFLDKWHVEAERISVHVVANYNVKKRKNKGSEVKVRV